MAEEEKDKTPEQGQEQKQEEQKQEEKPTGRKPEEYEAEIAKLKAAISNASSEAADYKKKYRATLDEQTRQAEERKEEFEKIQTELATLKAEKQALSYTNKLVAAGYDAQTAASMASLLPAEVNDDFFEAQKSFLENKLQEASSKKMSGQPDLSKGKDASGQEPPADPDKMTDEQWIAWRRTQLKKE